MRTSVVFSTGLLIGATTSFFLISGFAQLDKGISQTYRCDQLARETDALNSAGKIIQQLLEVATLSDLQDTISAAGLELNQFDKGDHTIVVVGHSSSTMALEFLVSEMGEIELHSFPGSASCDRSAN